MSEENSNPVRKKLLFPSDKKLGHLSAFPNTLQWNWIFTAVYWETHCYTLYEMRIISRSSFPRQDPKIRLLFDLIAKHHRKIRMSGKEGFYLVASGLGMMISQ